ncbi:hypothetical protein F0562_032173 [Nyssa sinensis]|uniref:Uncharacterized protein n=1 Tax=Nyssa sinensis TaxID=561372 RepID=A0A5J5AXT3_9ASTE|nr:hypothetical protein F0562_032173 [Nyssa sinensis]
MGGTPLKEEKGAVLKGKSGFDGAGREDASIHDKYSAHSGADRAKAGEFIPQATLDLEAEFGGFSEDPSFLMESFHGDSSFPSIRGRRSLNNGSHGGRGGGMQEYRRSNTQEPLGCDGRSCQRLQEKVKSDGAAHYQGIKESRNSALEVYSSLALCGNERLPLKAQNEEYPLGNSEMHEGDGSSSPEEEKGERYGVPLLVRPAICGQEGLSLKVQNGEYPFGNSEIHGGDGRPSQEERKGEMDGSLQK